MQIFKIIDRNVAALGTYERRAHINVPYTGMIAVGAAAAKVDCPSDCLCDGLATGLLVVGADGAKYFAQPK